MASIQSEVEVHFGTIAAANAKIEGMQAVIDTLTTKLELTTSAMKRSEDAKKTAETKVTELLAVVSDFTAMQTEYDQRRFVCC